VRWLTRRGAAAALAVGLATTWGFGWRGLALLLAFFVSGSLLTPGGGQRRARQVIANGGVAALAALAGSWAAFAGSIAAATADTWATEIGGHSPTAPRLITNGRHVPAGADGGITLLGTAGGLAGATFIAGLSFVLERRVAIAVSVGAAGMFGMLLDSFLGATLQGARAWLDNDVVNLAATASGAVVAAVVWRLCCSSP
jgi:uncharacterized protein (TIGR00297 family)